MKRLTVFLVAILITALPLFALSLDTIGFAQWNGAAAVTSLSSAPSVGAAMPAGTVNAMVCVRSGAISYRTDGVDPAATTGVRMDAGTCKTYTNEPYLLADFEWIEIDVGSTVTAIFYVWRR